MEKNYENIIEVIKTIFNFDIVRRIFFLSGIAASVVIGITLFQWIQDPVYRPLSYSVNDQNFSSIVSTLEKARIKFKINEANGTISVPLEDLNIAKLKLSSAGINKDEGFTYSFLNEQNKLGSSQFLENARYLRALEADLARTISAIQGISSAKVHIAIPQHNIFADENAKTTTSVVINILPGFEGDKEKIRAIIQLVAASVPELDPSNVAITDQYGHYLSSIINQDSILNQEQLYYQNNIQRYYEKRIQSLIMPIVGENKASINVNTNIDFTQKEEAKEEYDPANVLRSEQDISESNSSAAGAGVPGALSNQPPNADPKPAEPQSGQSRTETVKNYEVSKSMRYTKASSPKITSISVAVVLDDDAVYDDKLKKMVNKPLPKEKIDQITELVKSTIGFNQTRGDRVTVINSGFIAEKIENLPKVNIWEQTWFWDLIKQGSGIIAGFLFLFFLYKKIAPDFYPKKRKAGTDLNLSGTAQLVTPEMLKLKNEQIQILKELVSKDPNKVACIIKKWVTK